MSYMSNNHHYETGEAEPSPPAKDVLRVYGMKFCPFVHRLKLVLAEKGIEHETVNIHLQRKPEWFLQKNPRGVVPVIERNGQIIYESDITSEYADAAFEGKRKVVEQDPLIRAKGKVLLGDLTSAMGGVTQVWYRQKTDDEFVKGALEKVVIAFEALAKYLNTNKFDFIGGDKVGLNDFMIWPWLERISLFYMEKITENSTVLAYYERMSELESVKVNRHNKDLHMQLIESYKVKKIEYDIGTVIPVGVN